MGEDLVLSANAKVGTITTFRLSDDRLAPLSTTTLPGGSSTFVVDHRLQLVYAGVKTDPPSVVTLRIDRAEGSLTQQDQIQIPDAMTYLALSPEGDLLLGASYGGCCGYVWPAVGGRIAEPVSWINYENLHCVVVTNDAKFAYFVSLGQDLIAQFGLNAAGGLEPLDPPEVALPAGSGPRHLVLDGELTGYVITEFSGEVFRLQRDPQRGTLSVAEGVSVVDPAAGLGRSRFGIDPLSEHVIWAADVHVTEDFVLASERTASTVASVRRAAGGELGALASIRRTEQQPRGFCVTADGTRAIVVGERSNMISLYRIGVDGQLTELDRQPNDAGANWVRAI